MFLKILEPCDFSRGRFSNIIKIIKGIYVANGGIVKNYGYNLNTFNQWQLELNYQ